MLKFSPRTTFGHAFGFHLQTFDDRWVKFCSKVSPCHALFFKSVIFTVCKIVDFLGENFCWNMAGSRTTFIVLDWSPDLILFWWISMFWGGKNYDSALIWISYNSIHLEGCRLCTFGDILTYHILHSTAFSVVLIRDEAIVFLKGVLCLLLPFQILFLEFDPPKQSLCDI